jgi:hypothetical protein
MLFIVLVIDLLMLIVLVARGPFAIREAAHATPTARRFEFQESLARKVQLSYHGC